MDPFGLHQQPDLPEPVHEPEVQSSVSPITSRKPLWVVLLVLDTIFLFVFGGALAGMMYLNGNPMKVWQQLEQLFESAPPPQIAPRKVPPIQKKPVPPPTPAPAAPAPLPQQAAPSPAPAKPVSSSVQAKKARSVEFTCIVGNATEVYLKGSFLVHSKGGLKKMEKGEDGAWHLTPSLFPGTYKYQCVVNGKKSAYKTMDVPF